MGLYAKYGPARFIPNSSKINPHAVVAAWSAPQFVDANGLSVHGPTSESDPEILAYISRGGPIAEKLARVGLTIHDITAAVAAAGVFVDRDEKGQIVAAHLVPTKAGQDLVMNDAPELRAFLENHNA
jgi:hypothetical protein